jgi:hypothetical protein
MGTGMRHAVIGYPRSGTDSRRGIRANEKSIMGG